MQCKNSEVADTCNADSVKKTDSLCKVVVAGHVDHGKSTLLGRWLIDSGMAAPEHVTKVEKVCTERGLPFEPAFLLDALEEEQRQGVSIDSTRVHVEFRGSKFLFIDVPGHHEFIKNMTSGACDADLAVLMIDACEGIQPQTAGHARILSLLNVTDVVVAVNKMDKLQYDCNEFYKIQNQAEQLLRSAGLNCLAVVPISALCGVNLAESSPNLPWYSGPCLLELLSQSFWLADRKKSRSNDQFRMILQDVYKFDDERYFAGRVMSGSISVGDRVLFSPSGKTSAVRSILKMPELARPRAVAGESIAVTLSEQIYVERGEVLSLVDQAPETGNQFEVSLLWLSQDPLSFESPYLLKTGTAEVSCRLNPLISAPAEPVVTGCFADVLISTAQPVAFDRASLGDLSRLVLCSSTDTVAAGVISLQQRHIEEFKPTPNVREESGYLGRAEREHKQGHKGAVLWLTGLSGSGKSTVAKKLESELFESNRRVIVLDADSIRLGLCRDLGFSDKERTENIRRLAEAAKLCLNTGIIVIVACLSPQRRDRELARSIIGDDFNEIFVYCPIDVCQARDPKGLYQKAAVGAIKSFTGIDAPYQRPMTPDLTIDTSNLSVKSEVELILQLLQQKGII